MSRILKCLVLRWLPVCVLWLASPVYAELYKWVDENGRTHYGDTLDPAVDKQNAEVLQVPGHETPGAGEPAMAAVTGKPRLAITVRELPPARRAIGTYHSGRYCQPAMPVYWPDVQGFHDQLAPDSATLTGLLLEAFQSLAYPVGPDLSQGQPGKREVPGLLLMATVQEADIQPCATALQDPQAFLQPEKVPQQAFDRWQIALTWAWTLATEDGQVLYQGQSVGRGGGLGTVRALYPTYQEAVLDAVARLHNTPQFADALARAPVTALAPAPRDTLAARQPLMRDPQRLLPHLVVTTLPLPDTHQQLGVLRAGPFCRNVTPLQWPEIRNLNRSLAPDTLQIGEEAAKALSNFDYAVLHATEDTALAQQRRVDGLLLRLQVKNLYLDACAPDAQEAAQSYGKKPVQYSGFKRFQLQLALDWALSDSDGKPLFTGQSKTLTGNLQVNTSLQQVYTEAMNDAVMQVLVNPQFQSALDRVGQRTAPAPVLPAEAPPPAATGGWLDTLKAMGTPDAYRQRAALATVLAGMSQLKVAMTEYYLSENAWPTRFEQLGIDTAPVISDAQILLQPGGVLAAHLPASFGENKVLVLRAPADPAGFNAQWECQSNVADRPDTCSAF